jgi:hypothetical protein
VEIKCQLDATEVFVADLIACSTFFGQPLCPSSGAEEYYTDAASILQTGHVTLSSAPD